MDHSNRGWLVSAVLSLLAAVLLALAAFLPLYVSSSKFGPDAPVVVVGWPSAIYPQLFGVVLALAAGLLAFRRNGVLSVASGAFNLAVAWMLLTLYAVASDKADLGPGFWCLVGGVLLAVCAPLTRMNTLLGRLPRS
ncbi:hypothetical protein LWC34_23385 [Kibdelosporangium philippinense]|uniref:Uncharacterized protein n=2 Tax=Kibdelosporangium philippinense TaxID=211113 RepID=A0ABS8ZDX7_9PSEU|nr:hypothetical protein [Kibdelosporangium philippinense]MCE7005747.1 hypothetical protein [Kibdelosporangium philippinense]